MILHRAFLYDWDRQPNRTVRRFNAVAIAPTMFVVLNIVVENEDISLLDLMEIASPRKIVRLINDTFHTVANQMRLFTVLSAGQNLLNDKQRSIFHLVKYFRQVHPDDTNGR